MLLTPNIQGSMRLLITSRSSSQSVEYVVHSSWCRQSKLRSNLWSFSHRWLDLSWSWSSLRLIRGCRPKSRPSCSSKSTLVVLWLRSGWYLPWIGSSPSKWFHRAFMVTAFNLDYRPVSFQASSACTACQVMMNTMKSCSQVTYHLVGSLVSWPLPPLCLSYVNPFTSDSTSLITS